MFLSVNGKHTVNSGGGTQRAVIYHCPRSCCSVWSWHQRAAERQQQLIFLSGPDWSAGIKWRDCPRKEGHKDKERRRGRYRKCECEPERAGGKWLLFWRQPLFSASLCASLPTRTCTGAQCWGCKRLCYLTGRRCCWLRCSDISGMSVTVWARVSMHSSVKVTFVSSRCQMKLLLTLYFRFRCCIRPWH